MNKMFKYYLILHISIASSAFAMNGKPADTRRKTRLACANCRQAHEKCSNDRPCERCEIRGFKCIEEKKTGVTCTNCKTHHNGCDDKSPCNFCIQHGFECIRYTKKKRTRPDLTARNRENANSYENIAQPTAKSVVDTVEIVPEQKSQEDLSVFRDEDDTKLFPYLTMVYELGIDNKIGE